MGLSSGDGGRSVAEVFLRGAAVASEGWGAAVLVTIALKELVARHPSVETGVPVHTLSDAHSVLLS